MDCIRQHFRTRGQLGYASCGVTVEFFLGSWTQPFALPSAARNPFLRNLPLSRFVLTPGDFLVLGFLADCFVDEFISVLLKLFFRSFEVLGEAYDICFGRRRR